ncbi:hypothetical protein GCM10027447_16170 [Glycomyces halotolerans]
MLEVFRIWMHLLGLLIAVQFFLAGYGAIASGAPSEAFELHIANGRLIAIAALLGIVFAALARAGGRLVGLSAGILGLVALQSVIALVSVGGTVWGQSVFGLHAINGLVIMMLTGRAAMLAKRRSAERREPAGSAEPETASV